MLKAIRRFFGEKASSQVARQRMQVVLMHDRMDIAPDIMEAVKNDIIAVLSRYMGAAGAQSFLRTTRAAS